MLSTVTYMITTVIYMITTVIYMTTTIINSCLENPNGKHKQLQEVADHYYHLLQVSNRPVIFFRPHVAIRAGFRHEVSR